VSPELQRTRAGGLLAGDGTPREGASIAELTGHVDLSAWPDGSRLIVRKERPHPGAQTDVDGHR
jgi:hypothetical protein